MDLLLVRIIVAHIIQCKTIDLMDEPETKYHSNEPSQGLSDENIFKVEFQILGRY